MKRLHAEPVTSEEQCFAVAIPQRKSEHASKALDAVLAPLLPRVNNHLGIAFGPEAVAEAYQFRDELPIVVDLAVIDNDDAAVLVEQWLLSGRQVDDGQAPVTEANSGLTVQPHFIGPAMKLRFVHMRDKLSRNGPPSGHIHDPDDAAHMVFLSWQPLRSSPSPADRQSARHRQEERGRPPLRARARRRDRKPQPSSID